MQSSSANVCSICSKAFGSFKRFTVDEDVLKYLTFLFTTINDSALQNTQICENCLNKIQDARNFKILYVENCALTTSKEERTDSELSCICKICKRNIKKSSSALLNKEIKLIINDLIEGMQMNVETTEDSRICISCRESAVNFHSVVKLLSNFIELNGDIRIHLEKSNTTNLVEIKEESLTEYSNIPYEHVVVKSEPMEAENINKFVKMEVKAENEVNLTYDYFIEKNEETVIKTEDVESVPIEQTWGCNEDVKVNPNLASEHFTVDKNNIDIDNTSNICKFICDVCGYKAKRKCYLTNHMLAHKNVDEVEMFKCNVCEFKTKHKSSLRGHMLIHKSIDEIKMFKCDLCEHKAKRKQDLKTHMLIHKNGDEIKMFTCDVCGYKTKYKSTLKGHMLIHRNVDEIEMFSCNVCGYKAKQKGNIKCHMLIHKDVNEIKMFTCDVCGHKAKRKANLKNHMQIHKNAGEIM